MWEAGGRAIECTRRVNIGRREQGGDKSQPTCKTGKREFEARDFRHEELISRVWQKGQF